MTPLQHLSPTAPPQPIYCHDWREYRDHPTAYQMFEYDYAHPELSAHWPAEYQHPNAAQVWLAQYPQEDTQRFVELCQVVLIADPETAANTMQLMADAIAAQK